MFLRRRRIALLLIGDIILFYVALATTIAVSFPIDRMFEFFNEHFVPFSYIISFSLLVFLVAGLYDKETLFFRRKLPSVLFSALLINSIFAVFFFYLIQLFAIAPKTNLFIYLLVSFVLILLWRLYGVRLLVGGKNPKALIIGSGATLQEIVNECTENKDHGIFVDQVINLDTHVLSPVHIAEQAP